VRRHAVRKSALRRRRHVFDGSVEKVFAALPGGDAARVSDDELTVLDGGEGEKGRAA
jgi:hypothetical protein